jgi:hypothetical protein
MASQTKERERQKDCDVRLLQISEARSGAFRLKDPDQLIDWDLKDPKGKTLDQVNYPRLKIVGFSTSKAGLPVSTTMLALTYGIRLRYSTSQRRYDLIARGHQQ